MKGTYKLRINKIDLNVIYVKKYLKLLKMNTSFKTQEDIKIDMFTKTSLTVIKNENNISDVNIITHFGKNKYIKKHYDYKKFRGEYVKKMGFMKKEVKGIYEKMYY